MKKVIYFNNIIAPTNTRLFNTFYTYFQKKWIEFKIFFNSASEGNRSWDYSKEIKKFLFEYKILNVKTLHQNGNKDNHYFHFNKGLSRILQEENPDIIIHWWWAWISAWQAQSWCKKNKKKFILWSGSTHYEKSWRRIITRPLVAYLIRNSDGFFSYGTRATEYLVSLWAKEDTIYPLYNTVDVDFFLSESETLQKDKESLKKKYNITTKYVLLFVWQLIQRKWIYNILDGFIKFQKEHDNFSLIFAWNGEEEENIKKIISTHNLKNIHLTGHFQQDKISELYSLADIFTLPSEEEVWWLVINEAMCFWLPIITSFAVWASIDLVKEWKNGYIMEENTAKEFYIWLNYIYENNLMEINTSREIIQQFNVQDIVQNISITL